MLLLVVLLLLLPVQQQREEQCIRCQNVKNVKQGAHLEAAGSEHRQIRLLAVLFFAVSGVQVSTGIDKQSADFASLLAYSSVQGSVSAAQGNRHESI